MKMDKKDQILMLKELATNKIDRAVFLHKSSRGTIVKGKMIGIVTDEDYIEFFNNSDDYFNTVLFLLNAQGNMDSQLEMEPVTMGMLPGFYETIGRTKSGLDCGDIYRRSLNAMLMHNDRDKNNYNEYIRFACLSYDLIEDKGSFPEFLENAYSRLGSKIGNISNIIEVYYDRLIELTDCKEILQDAIDERPLSESDSKTYLSRVTEKVRRKVQHVQYPICLKDYL